MKKTLIGISLLFITSLIYGQIGFMGNRHFVSSDIFNAYYQGKYNLSYQYCVGNSVMLKVSASKFGKTYKFVTSKYESYYDHSLNQNFTIDHSDISFNGFSWEAGINLGYYPFTGMPMPIGYYMGISYEHISGNIEEKCRVYTNNQLTLTDKDFYYNSKAGIFKITYGRNSIIKKNLVLNTDLQLGLFFGNAVNSESTGNTKAPQQFLPKCMPFLKNYDFDNGFNNSNKYRYFNFYIMPEISLGYMF